MSCSLLPTAPSLSLLFHGPLQVGPRSRPCLYWEGFLLLMRCPLFMHFFVWFSSQTCCSHSKISPFYLGLLPSMLLQFSHSHCLCTHYHALQYYSSSILDTSAPYNHHCRTLSPFLFYFHSAPLLTLHVK